MFHAVRLGPEASRVKLSTIERQREEEGEVETDR